MVAASCLDERVESAAGSYDGPALLLGRVSYRGVYSVYMLYRHPHGGDMTRPTSSRMNEPKTEVLNLRMSPSVKSLLRAAADEQHRTLSNMLEVLILEHCDRNDIASEESSAHPKLKARRNDRT